MLNKIFWKLVKQRDVLLSFDSLRVIARILLMNPLHFQGQSWRLICLASKGLRWCWGLHLAPGTKNGTIFSYCYIYGWQVISLFPGFNDLDHFEFAETVGHILCQSRIWALKSCEPIWYDRSFCPTSIWDNTARYFLCLIIGWYIYTIHLALS